MPAAPADPAPPPPSAPMPPPRSRFTSFLHTGPLRRFLSTHEVHVLPHRVSHSRRARQVATALAVAALAFSAWYFVLPRTDVTLRAQYHEGLFNTIAVDMTIVNSGTNSLSPLHLELVVTDETNHSAMGFFALNTTLPGHQEFHAHSVEFKGDQITTTYSISITVAYDAGSGRITKTFSFATEEPYMNLYFDARVA